MGEHRWWCRVLPAARITVYTCPECSYRSLGPGLCPSARGCKSGIVRLVPIPYDRDSRALGVIENPEHLGVMDYHGTFGS